MVGDVGVVLIGHIIINFIEYGLEAEGIAHEIEQEQKQEIANVVIELCKLVHVVLPPIDCELFALNNEAEKFPAIALVKLKKGASHCTPLDSVILFWK